jgi:hypothetical protein
MSPVTDEAERQPIVGQASSDMSEYRLHPKLRLRYDSQRNNHREVFV